MDSFELLKRKVRAEEYEMEVKRGIQHQPMSTLTSSQTRSKEESGELMTLYLTE